MIFLFKLINCFAPFSLFRPREEKLFEMGWKDNCYFYGDPQTWMIPLSTKLGSEARNHARSFRGRDSILESLSTISICAIPPEEVDNMDELEFNAHHLCEVDHEDMYILQEIPSLLKTLPQFLKGGPRVIEMNEFCSIQKKRNKNMDLLISRASYILPEIHNRIAWSHGRLGFENCKEKDLLALELMPALRRIALYEQAAEFAEIEAGRDASTDSFRRTTRRQAKAKRHHYFDKLSTVLRQDGADLNSSELGFLLASDILEYC